MKGRERPEPKGLSGSASTDFEPTEPQGARMGATFATAGHRALGVLAFLAIIVMACSEPVPAGPEVPAVRAAKGGIPGPPGGGNGDPTVDDTDPASASQSTTLDVRVLGSNYDAGSQVAFLLDGVATGRVTTNSTTFVSDKELVANVTIAADAEPDLYDVQVTTAKGKKGIGIELFEVVTTANLLTVGDGVVGDGMDLYFDTGQFMHVTNRFRLNPECDGGRSMSLVNVIPVDPPGYYPSNQPTCNGGSQDGWVFLHLPDLLTIDYDCGGPGEPACPFALLPSFEKNRNWEKNGIVQATGGFAPTAHYFLRDLTTGEHLDFVFQDPRVVQNSNGTMTFTASEAHFYYSAGEGGFRCEGDQDGDPDTIDDCMDITIPIELVVRPGS